MVAETPWEGGSKMSFLNHEKALITAMVPGRNPNRVKCLMDKSREIGCDAFGMQIETLLSEFQTEEVYRELFSYAKEKPVYITNYRVANNVGKSDHVLACELLAMSKLGGTLFDVMGDLFDKQDDEVARSKAAIAQQMELIEKLHANGREVLMSSHVLKFTSAERVLEIAFEHKRRGADICKIVTGADTMEEQIENLRIINLLKKELGLPFLFLCGGECRILRRIGGELGCCMYLGVPEQDDLTTPVQPPLKNLIAIRDNM